LTSDASRPFILVLAGVNGAGKSSVGGARISEHNLAWFNPDTFTRELIARQGLSLAEANAAAWKLSRDQLEHAIAQGTNFAFETTLGGNTISSLLQKASITHDVVMWFCGLASVELHLQRVQARVSRGGHNIPQEKIRDRWNSSRANLIRLLPQLAHVQVFDNSTEAQHGEPIPNPVLVLELSHGQLLFPDPSDLNTLARTPEWAMPIVEAAIRLQV
jgi:predicted ABC-type ATPase